MLPSRVCEAHNVHLCMCACLQTVVLVEETVFLYSRILPSFTSSRVVVFFGGGTSIPHGTVQVGQEKAKHFPAQRARRREEARQTSHQSGKSGKFLKTFQSGKTGGFQPKSGKIFQIRENFSNQGTFFKTIFKPFNLRKNLFGDSNLFFRTISGNCT